MNKEKGLIYPNQSVLSSVGLYTVRACAGWFWWLVARFYQRNACFFGGWGCWVFVRWMYVSRHNSQFPIHDVYLISFYFPLFLHLLFVLFSARTATLWKRFPIVCFPKHNNLNLQKSKSIVCILLNFHHLLFLPPHIFWYHTS